MPQTPFIALTLALLLNVAAWAGITVSRTYVDVLFLSSYPVDFLPFFFIGQTVLVLVVTLLISPLAARGSTLINSSIFFIAALTVVNGDLLVQAEIPGMAFAFSLWLSAIPVILLVMSQNTIADAFDLRRFKKNLIWVTMAGNLGGLLIGMLTPWLIAQFGIAVLMYVLVGMIGFVGFASAWLKPLPVLVRKSAENHSPFNYPLFQIIALCTFFMMVVDTFADYALKAELGSRLGDKEAIGSFMGPFYGISNALMIFLQLAGAQTLLKYFGVAGLMVTIPLFAGLGGLALLFLPGLWSAAFLRLGENALRFSFFSIGREVALKPLPARIRRAGKFLIIAAGYVGAGLASLILLVSSGQLGITVVAVLLLLICLLWLWATQRLRAVYQATLEEAIRIKRFNVNEDSGLAQEKENIRQVAELALQDQNPDTVRFGFTLLARTRLTHVPNCAHVHLNAPDPELRVGFINAVHVFHDTSTVPMLRARLEIEEDGKVIWWLLKTLATLAPEHVLTQATQLLENEDPLVRAGAVVVLLSGGGLEHLIAAANSLNQMLHHPNATMRKGAAYAISALKIGKLENELRALLEDPDELVNIAAMWAVADQNNVNLAGALAAKLGHGRASHYAGRTLRRIGEPALPYLLDIIRHASLNGRGQSAARAAVRVLASIRCEAADMVVVEAVRCGGVLTRTHLAKECAMRAKYKPNSEVLIREARQWLLDEAHLAHIFNAARYAPELPEHIRLEITHRGKMARARLLYWFDVYTKSVDLIGIIPVILNDNTSQKNQAQHATAIEFLETLSRDKVVKKALMVFEESVTHDAIKNAVAVLPEIKDAWLTQISQAPLLPPAGGIMDITHKVMLLRKVKLFADLPGEILLTIAESCEDREVVRGEKLMSQGDAPDGLYIIASGMVSIEKNGVCLAELREGGFFGELGLFDDAPRKADAIVRVDGMVLFLEKEVFDGLTEDLPEVLRALIKTVISYIK
jgi:hypothetical protein